MNLEHLEANRRRFWFELEAVAELIQFALDRKQNPAIAPSILHAIGHHMHEMKNIFTPLSAEIEFIREGQKNDMVKPEGIPGKSDPGSRTGTAADKGSSDPAARKI